MRGFTLYTFIRIALKHILILILSGLIFALGAFTYCEFVAAPIYSAKGSLLVTSMSLVTVGEDGEAIKNTDVVASRNISDTVIDILKTKDVFKNLSNSIGNKYTYQNLLSRVSISKSPTDSLFLTVSFSANSREEAIELVNAFLDLAPERIHEEIPGCRAKALSFADSSSQIYPRTSVLSVTAFTIGAVAAYAVLILIYSANSIIRSDEDFRERFDTEIIGIIPDFARAKHDRTYYKNSYYAKGGDEDGK